MSRTPTSQAASKSDRISIRLDAEAKKRIERAAALDQRSVTSFILASALQSANLLLKENEEVRLSERDWDRLMDALENPPKPSKALKKAFADYAKRNIRSDA